MHFKALHFHSFIHSFIYRQQHFLTAGQRICGLIGGSCALRIALIIIIIIMSGRRGRTTNHSSCHKSRCMVLSYDIRCENVGRCFFRFVTIYAFDRRTDRRTDRLWLPSVTLRQPRLCLPHENLMFLSSRLTHLAKIANVSN